MPSIHFLIQSKENGMKGWWIVYLWQRTLSWSRKFPLSQNATEDTLYWPYSSTRDYSCKFGYRFLKAESDMQANTQDPPIRDKQVWKEMWQMKAPPKVKNFIWWACCNALPTKQALMRRKIIANPICERCKTVVKDTEHALWSCSELDVVWADQEA